MAGDNVTEELRRRRQGAQAPQSAPPPGRAPTPQIFGGRLISPAAPQGDPGAGDGPGSWIGPVGHPGFAESLIPVWGSGREAIADLQEGDNVGAAINAAAAASDLFMAGSVAHAVEKGGLYAIKGAFNESAAKAATWKRVRERMGKEGMLSRGQHGHHWLIPRNGWGKAVPDVVKNHPLNIKGMPSPEVHSRVHGPYKGKLQYGPLGQYWYGTPAWGKAATVGAVAHPAGAAKAWWEDDE